MGSNLLGDPRCVGRGIFRRNNWLVVQGRDRGEQFSTVSDRGHANRDQIFRGEVRQYLGVDIIVAKRRRVPFKTEISQPGCDVHAYLPVPLFVVLVKAILCSTPARCEQNRLCARAIYTRRRVTDAPKIQKGVWTG